MEFKGIFGRGLATPTHSATVLDPAAKVMVGRESKHLIWVRSDWLPTIWLEALESNFHGPVGVAGEKPTKLSICANGANDDWACLAALNCFIWRNSLQSGSSMIIDFS